MPGAVSAVCRMWNVRSEVRVVIWGVSGVRGGEEGRREEGSWGAGGGVN